MSATRLPGLTSSDAQTRLGIYLNDHHGGSVVGRELAARAASSNSGNEYGEFLSGLVREIEEDVRSLEELMRRLDVSTDPLKAGVAWATEKLGRLKLNGQLLGYSPLSRLVEIETLMLGVSGKLALWLAVKATLGADPRLEGFDLERLIARVRSQRDGLERRRIKAARSALTD